MKTTEMTQPQSLFRLQQQRYRRRSRRRKSSSPLKHRAILRAVLPLPRPTVTTTTTMSTTIMTNMTTKKVAMLLVNLAMALVLANATTTTTDAASSSSQSRSFPRRRPYVRSSVPSSASSSSSSSSIPLEEAIAIAAEAVSSLLSRPEYNDYGDNHGNDDGADDGAERRRGSLPRNMQRQRQQGHNRRTTAVGVHPPITPFRGGLRTVVAREKGDDGYKVYVDNDDRGSDSENHVEAEGGAEADRAPRPNKSLQPSDSNDEGSGNGDGNGDDAETTKGSSASSKAWTPDNYPNPWTDPLACGGASTAGYYDDVRRRSGGGGGNGDDTDADEQNASSSSNGINRTTAPLHRASPFIDWFGTGLSDLSVGVSSSTVGIGAGIDDPPPPQQQQRRRRRLLFCDPDGVLDPESLRDVAVELRHFSDAFAHSSSRGRGSGGGSGIDDPSSSSSFANSNKSDHDNKDEEGDDSVVKTNVKSAVDDDLLKFSTLIKGGDFLAPKHGGGIGGGGRQLDSEQRDDGGAAASKGDDGEEQDNAAVTKANRSDSHPNNSTLLSASARWSSSYNHDHHDNNNDDDNTNTDSSKDLFDDDDDMVGVPAAARDLHRSWYNEAVGGLYSSHPPSPEGERGGTAATSAASSSSKNDEVGTGGSIEVAIALVERINLPAILRADSYFFYSDQDDMVNDAAQFFARYVHDAWSKRLAQEELAASSAPASSNSSGGGSNNNDKAPPLPTNIVLIFISTEDRICYISSGSNVSTVLPWWRLEHVVQDMKQDLRRSRTGPALSVAIDDLAQLLLDGPPTLFDRANDFVGRFGVVMAFTIFTFVFATWGECRDRRKRIFFAERRSRMTRAEAEAARGLQREYRTKACPICLEQFDLHNDTTYTDLDDDDDDREEHFETKTNKPSTKRRVDEHGIPLLGTDDKPIKLLRCGHIFDETCWTQWVDSGTGNPWICPVCRQDVGGNSKTGGGVVPSSGSSTFRLSWWRQREASTTGVGANVDPMMTGALAASTPSTLLQPVGGNHARHPQSYGSGLRSRGGGGRGGSVGGSVVAGGVSSSPLSHPVVRRVRPVFGGCTSQQGMESISEDSPLMFNQGSNTVNEDDY